MKTKIRQQPRRCTRCIRGNLYSEDPTNPKADIWCFQCGEWIRPPDFKPLPYAPHLEDGPQNVVWRIDEYGDIVDELDEKIEAMLEDRNVVTVSGVAKKFHCSNSAARMSLERLVRINKIDTIEYGPQKRWLGYQML